jgi:chorismate mutase
VNGAADDDDPSAALRSLRRSFDDVDARLVALLAHRVALSRSAGAVKLSQGLPVVDTVREADAAAVRAALARQHGLDEDFVDEVFAVIVRYSRRLQGAG